MDTNTHAIESSAKPSTKTSKLTKESIDSTVKTVHLENVDRINGLDNISPVDNMATQTSLPDTMASGTNDNHTDNNTSINQTVTNGSNKTALLLYNPQNMDAHQLSEGFSIRKKEYQRIWQDVLTGDMQHPETHYLLQGVRGSGKTTILSKLAYDVADAPSLNSWLLPILFNEEEYGIYSLFTFWLRVAEQLAEKHPQYYQPLFNSLSALSSDDAQQAWQWIAHALNEQQHKILLLVDNMAEMFDGFDTIEHAQLREVLSLAPQIRLIGASSVIWEAHFDALAPFYQFFKLVTLKPIDEHSMHALLRSLAKQTSAKAIQQIDTIITQHPERIEAVRRLTNGVPRTIVLLFHIIMEGTKDSSYAYLQETIDKTTPLYQHRMADLSKQQRVIVHSMAMNWDAMNAKEIAEITRLPSKTISAQLAKLHKDWIIEKIPTHTKNHLYIIKERFFNIWYLMRFGKKTDKRRVLWLTRFLESWCDENELTIMLISLGRLAETKDYRINIDYLNAILSSEKIPDYLRSGFSNKLIATNPDTILVEEKNNNDGGEVPLLKIVMKQFIVDGKLNIEELFSQCNDIIDYIIINSFYYSNVLNDAKTGTINIFNIIEKKIEDDGFQLNNLYFLVLVYFILPVVEKKETALFFVKKMQSMTTETVFLISFVNVLVWNDKIVEAIEIVNKMSSNNADMPLKTEILDMLLLFLAKNQTEFVFDFLAQNEFKEAFKPLYYATASLLTDERNQEYLRMGSELQSTVNEILDKVEAYKEKYT